MIILCLASKSFDLRFKWISTRMNPPTTVSQANSDFPLPWSLCSILHFVSTYEDEHMKSAYLQLPPVSIGCWLRTATVTEQDCTTQRIWVNRDCNYIYSLWLIASFKHCCSGCYSYGYLSYMQLLFVNW